MLVVYHKPSHFCSHCRPWEGSSLICNTSSGKILFRLASKPYLLGIFPAHLLYIHIFPSLVTRRRIFKGISEPSFCFLYTFHFLSPLDIGLAPLLGRVSC